MIVFDSNKIKKLRFRIKEITNISVEEIVVYLKILVDGIGYSFPGKINKVNDIMITVPAMQNILKKFDADTNYPVKIEVIAGNNYFVAYDDVCQIIKRLEMKIEKVNESDVKTEVKEPKPAVVQTKTKTNIMVDIIESDSDDAAISEPKPEPKPEPIVEKPTKIVEETEEERLANEILIKAKHKEEYTLDNLFLKN